MADYPVPFNLKHFEQLTASKLNWMIGAQGVVTDYNIGSVARTMLEAVSVEEEEIYYRLYRAILEAIPIAIYLAFDFTLRAATTATGTVTFSRSTVAPVNYVIPLGTRVATTDGLVFVTTVAATLLTGHTSVAVAVIAEQAGAAGVVLAHSITEFRAAILGVESVTNGTAAAGGSDEETEDERKGRFQDFITSLARAPVGGIKAGARTATLTDANGGILEQVRKVSVYEPFLTDSTVPAGVFSVYIDNGTGTASEALRTRVQAILDGYLDTTGTPIMGYKAAGCVGAVLPVVAQIQPVAAAITPKMGVALASLQNALAAAVKSVFTVLEIGDRLDWDILLTAIMTTDGVKTATLTVPSTHVNATDAYQYRILPGTMTFTQQ